MPNDLHSTIAVGVVDAEVSTDHLLPGQGFNQSTGEQGRPDAVIWNGPDELIQINPGAGQKSQLIFQYVEDFESLKSHLGVAVSASFGMGIYSAEGSASYSRSESHTRFDSYLLIGVKVINPTVVLKNSQLSPAAIAYISAGDLSSFLTYFGNSYVYGYVTGGEILGIVRYTATSDQQASKRIWRRQVNGLTVSLKCEKAYVA